MEIIAGTSQFKLNKKTAVAIGKFDGLHRGHRKLLEEILDYKKHGMAVCVFTFDPPPSVFFGIGDTKELMTRDEKRYFLDEMGVDVLIEFPLNSETAAITPEEFVKNLLVKQMNVGFVAAGSDLSFGAGGKGDAVLLRKMATQYGFQVKIIDKIRIHGTQISSTCIKEQIENGRMELAEEMLGMPYSFIGRVVHGNRIGRTIGMPTVNLPVPAAKVIPPCGVYYSGVWYHGKYYRGISNVGYKPTVTDEKIMGIETYLYDFNEEIYGEEIQIGLYAFKRPELRFHDLNQLKEQLNADIEMGRYWRKH